MAEHEAVDYNIVVSAIATIAFVSAIFLIAQTVLSYALIWLLINL